MPWWALFLGDVQERREVVEIIMKLANICSFHVRVVMFSRVPVPSANPWWRRQLKNNSCLKRRSARFAGGPIVLLAYRSLSHLSQNSRQSLVSLAGYVERDGLIYVNERVKPDIGFSGSSATSCRGGRDRGTLCLGTTTPYYSPQ